MKNRKLVEKLIKLSNEIYKNEKPKADHIIIAEYFIQQTADEYDVSFDDMVKIIQEELKPKK